MNMEDRLADARSFALAAHGAQQYGGRHPYSFHLDAVVELLAPFCETAQVIGYLHDVVEDTAVSIDEIKLRFGDEVAECVALVTDEPGANRKERKARTNEKLSSIAAGNELALIVKAADRLANLRQSRGDDSKLAMYRREHSAFRRAVYRPNLCDVLWHEMDEIIAQ
jgi:(p)ppGpp synthase/HD superfamily hydrolase